ncbi:MAG: F0F1 ATP synthase subunit A [Bacteroidota bacterium]|nr:F0F1 ATP synthase subunit A [Bacteroidota bacterium]
MKKSIFRILFLFAIISICVGNSNQINANEKGNKHVESAEKHDNTEIKKFNAGEFIINHVVDHYSWHIFTYKDTHVSLHLPVILYSKTKGLVCFSSKRIEHGHAYKNFKLAENGNIVEIDNNGKIVGPVLDISITKNVFALFFSCGLLLIIFLSVAKSYTRNKDLPPKGLQSLLEPLIIFIRDDVAKASIGEKNYEKFTPFLLTIFFFILFNNLLGLIPIIPGGANVTGNITITLVLALFTFIVTTISGNKNYWKHIFNGPGIPWWLKAPVPLIPFIELVGIFIKPFVLMVRLFANITAGHIIGLGFLSLIFIFGNIEPYLGYAVSPVTIIFTVFMSILELLVAFIQAYVFTVLSSIFFGMATEDGH